MQTEHFYDKISPVISLIASLVLLPSRFAEWTTVQLPSSSRSDAIEIGIAKNPTVMDYPDKDPLVRKWTSSDNGIEVEIECALPAGQDENGDTISDGMDAVRKDIAASLKVIKTNGARTMVLERAGIKIDLTVATDIYGNLRLMESCQKPIVFKRTILAKADRVDDALDILKYFSIRTGSNDSVRVYANGFPKGWTCDFGDKKIPIPMPQDADKSDTSLGKIDVKEWGDDKSYWYWISFWNEFKGDAKDLANKPFPHEGGVVNPQVTKSEVVTIDDQKVLRVRGTGGISSDPKEWIAWYIRSKNGILHAVYSVRKQGTSWPKDLPFSTTSEGGPVTDNIFSEILGWTSRTLSFGGATITADIFGQTNVQNPEWIDYFRDGDDCIIQAYLGPTAEKKWEDFNPAGRWLPKVFENAKNIIDISAKKFGATDWYVIRLIGVRKDGARAVQRIELVHTKQNGQSFLVWLIGTDVKVNQEMSKRIMMSIKDGEGNALLPNYPPDEKCEYFLPYHQLWFPMTSLGTRPTAFQSEFNFRWQGWPLKDGETNVYFSHDGNETGKEPGNYKFAEVEGYKRISPNRHPELKAFGKEASIEESDWEKGGQKVTITSVSHRPGASVHFIRKIGVPDTAWKEFIAKEHQ